MPVIMSLLAFYETFRLLAVKYERKEREYSFWFMPKPECRGSYSVEGTRAFKDVNEVWLNGKIVLCTALGADTVQEGFALEGQDLSGSVSVWLEGVCEEPDVREVAFVSENGQKYTFSLAEKS